MVKAINQFRGPSLIPLATLHILVFVAGLVAAAMLRHGALYVTPFASAEDLRSFFAKNPTAVRVSNFFLFGSAVPFGIFAVTIVSRLRYMGVRAAGTNIALLGGRFSKLPARRSCLRRGLRFAGCGSVGHKLLHAAFPAVAGNPWNGYCHNRRTLLVQSHCISGKLFYSHYQIRRLHLDGLYRCSTNEKSEGSAGCIWRRLSVGCDQNS